MAKRKQFTSHSGHPLTPNEIKFIDEYIESGNGSQSVIKAGYKSKTPQVYAHTLLTKDYIAEEIKYRLEQIQSEKIASAEEIMQYFSSVMRGEIKDQFGLEASLSERTKAAQELAKRQIDMANRGSAEGGGEVRIVLDWTRPKEEQTDTPKAVDITIPPRENNSEND